ncbi:CBS domain-containing protein [Rhizobiaceae bacterium n13]|uniref:CBS domain-containing protein n=1 Tax=Ferirhizobium litorale TaxID=2927786 RepID=A0AAE3QJ33_9HYPH|nr:CBS domain-containing protein [Fererhizobium litorale]MDI7864047.1 CBS domain-containing protein [Fererhizobium litorale]MDI7924470.1 CBS domain-containing protein [Fererhizobium litorale]
MSIPVKAILEQKGRDVVTVGPETTLNEAAATLNKYRIGAVVVVGKDSKIVGIFTERDVVTAIAKHGTAALEQSVSSLMTPEVFRCREETTVNELMGVMTERRFRHVPVENHGKLVGIISIGDVVKQRIREVELETEQIIAYIAG